jgi:hypothetical protein
MKARSTPVFTALLISIILIAGLLFYSDSVSAQIPDSFTIPESKLLDVEFSSTNWGGTVTRTDAVGEAVLFLFSGLSASSTGIKDDYPVDTVYGQLLPSHGNGDFSIFDGYVLTFENLDASPVSCSLYINTGFTGPSGNPSNNPANDTFWQSPWTTIQPGQKKTLRLEFDNAQAWNISDNPSPHTQGSNGQITAINDYDRAELSSIGFQINASSNPEASILVTPAEEPICTTVLPEDLDGNCRIDLVDLAILADGWLVCNIDPSQACWE